jgi:hypothetical protein
MRFPIISESMQIRIPDPPVPLKKQKLALAQVASRWRIPVSFARVRLERAGIQIIPVERPPTDGVLLTDLLQYEARMRAEEAAVK